LQIIGTQSSLFVRVIDGLNAMAELVDTKCKGEDEINQYVCFFSAYYSQLPNYVPV
jgi:hypothetical protein